MFRTIITFALFSLFLTAHAGDMVLNDIKAQNGVQLSAEELNQLLPNAKVISYFRGSTRTWTNGPDGKFVAYGDARGTMKTLQTQATGHGTWHIGKNGQYCISLDWPKRSEKWCKYIYKTGEKYYGVKSLDDGDGEALEFVFTK